MNRINNVTNSYAKAYQSDKLELEMRTTVLSLCNVLTFTGSINSFPLSTLLTELQRDLAPVDASLFEILSEELLVSKFKFQLLDELSKHNFE